MYTWRAREREIERCVCINVCMHAVADTEWSAVKDTLKFPNFIGHFPQISHKEGGSLQKMTCHFKRVFDCTPLCRKLIPEHSEFLYIGTILETHSANHRVYMTWNSQKSALTFFFLQSGVQSKTRLNFPILQFISSKLALKKEALCRK